MFTLKQNESGQYILDTQDTYKAEPAVVNSGEYEAYTGEKSKDTTLTEQTEKIIEREAPGAISLTTDPNTGEVITKQESEKRQIKTGVVEKPAPASSQAATVPSVPIERSRSSAVSPGQAVAQQPTSYFNAGVPNFVQTPQSYTSQPSTRDKLVDAAIDVGSDIAIRYIGSKLGFPVGGTTGGNIGGISGGGFGGGFNPSSSTGGFSGAAGSGYAAAAGTLLQGGSVKDAAKVGGGTAVGTAIGTAVAGPIGGAIGGAIGGMFGCFLPETLVTMADGTKKKIVDIDLKDNIKVGGYVTATGKFLVINLYDYKGIKVSGSHMVKEDDKWLRVKDSKLAKSLGNDEHVVYTLGTQNRRILINDILFTDYFEVDEQIELVSEGDKYFDTWRLHSNQIEDRNVNIMNAS